MKNFKFIAIFLVFVTFNSCETTELDIIQDPSAIGLEEANRDLLFNAGQLGFNSFFQGLQGLTATVSRMELMRNSPFYAAQYQADSFNGVWSNAYANCLIELRASASAALEDAAVDPNFESNNYVAITQIMESYVMLTLVDVFGDVPYSEAVQGLDGIIDPRRDAGEEIYSAVVDLLQDSIEKIDADVDDTPEIDLFYDGDMSKWRALANSLLLKAAVTSRLQNSNSASLANSVINSGDYITDNSQDFQFNYGNNPSNPDSRHPLFLSQYVGGASLYMSNDFINRMEGDPRFNYYFYQQDGPGGFEGRDHGDAGPNVASEFPQITIHGLYPVGGQFNDGSTGPGSQFDGVRGAGASIIMTHAFTQFLIAEAELVLNNNSGAARTAYEAGIQASMDKVTTFRPAGVPSGSGATPSEINDYITAALASYDAAGSNKLDLIIKEYYKAAWGNGIDVYNNLRRTGFPSDLAPSIAPDPGVFTYTMLYPQNYVDNNNSPDAVQKTVDQRAWWAESSLNLNN
jgi:hypothetical protein